MIEYVVDFVDDSGLRREVVIEAESLVDLARKLAERGAKDVLGVFTEREVRIAIQRARKCEEVWARL